MFLGRFALLEKDLAASFEKRCTEVLLGGKEEKERDHSAVSKNTLKAQHQALCKNRHHIRVTC